MEIVSKNTSSAKQKEPPPKKKINSFTVNENTLPRKTQSSTFVEAGGLASSPTPYIKSFPSREHVMRRMLFSGEPYGRLASADYPELSIHRIVKIKPTVHSTLLSL